jgi:hypothetical protein
MKNIALNTLTYTGVVTLSQYIGQKKVKIAQIHNKGGNPLFDFLSDCLIGEIDSARAKKPEKIRLVILDDTNTPYEFAPGSSFIYPQVQPKKGTRPDESQVTYSFLIPRELFENISITDSNLGLGLYPNSATESGIDNYAAFCLLGDALNANLKASLVVDWKLIISNRQE